MTGVIMKRRYDLGLIVPLQVEWDAIEAEFERGDDIKDGTIYYYEFWSKSCKKSIIASLLGDSQYGPMEAAIRAQALLGFADVDVLALVGIAGSITSDLRLGDVVVANKVIAYEERSKAVREGDHTKVLRSPDSFDITERLNSALVNFKISRTGRPQLRTWQRECGERLAALNVPKNIVTKHSREEPESEIGRVASGNTVVAATPSKAELIALDRKILAVETEASGVGRVARKAEKDFIVVRGISDPSDESKNELESSTAGAFREYAARNAAAYLRHFLSWDGSNDAFPSMPSDRSRERARLKFKDGTGLADFLSKLPAIIGLVRKASEDTSMEYRATREGCIELEIEGSSAGFDRLEQLFDSGELTGLEGFDLLKIIREGSWRRVAVADFARAATGVRTKTARRPTRKRFSEFFELEREQGELDFVDVTPGADTALFVDPHSMSQRSDSFASRCQRSVTSFFDHVLQLAVKGEREEGIRLLAALSEPYETCLGLSKGHTHGRGLGRLQGEEIFDRLAESRAVTTGMVKDLGDTELFVDGIGHDKISDITTNLIRRELIEYTQAQCELLGIPMQESREMRVWDRALGRWDVVTPRLPRVRGAEVVLVPKSFVSSKPSIDSGDYYRNFVLSQYEEEELRKSDSPYVYKNRAGDRRVRRTELRKARPFSKRRLLDFTDENPAALSRYKLAVGTPSPTKNWQLPAGGNEPEVADNLRRRLDRIEPGQSHAAAYHKLMIGALEMLLYPEFQWPRKFSENGVLEMGYENSASKGALYSARIDPDRRISHALITCSNNGSIPIDKLMQRAPADVQAMLPNSIVVSVSRTPVSDRVGIIADRPIVNLDDGDIRRGLAVVGTADEGLVVRKIQQLVSAPHDHEPRES